MATAPSNIIDGKAIAAAIREEIKYEVSAMKEKPGLAVVLASRITERLTNLR